MEKRFWTLNSVIKISLETPFWLILLLLIIVILCFGGLVSLREERNKEVMIESYEWTKVPCEGDNYVYSY